MSKVKRTTTCGDTTITIEFNSVGELIKFLEWEQTSKKQDKQKGLPVIKGINKELDTINDLFKSKPLPNTPQWDQRGTHPYCPTMDILCIDKFMAQDKLGLAECRLAYFPDGGFSHRERCS